MVSYIYYIYMSLHTPKMHKINQAVDLVAKYHSDPRLIYFVCFRRVQWYNIIHILYVYTLYDTVSYIMMQYDTYIISICICTVWYSVYMYIQSIIQSTIQSIIQYHIVLYCVCTWSYPWSIHFQNVVPWIK